MLNPELFPLKPTELLRKGLELEGRAFQLSNRHGWWEAPSASLWTRWGLRECPAPFACVMTVMAMGAVGAPTTPEGWFALEDRAKLMARELWDHGAPVPDLFDSAASPALGLHRVQRILEIKEW